MEKPGSGAAESDVRAIVDDHGRSAKFDASDSDRKTGVVGHPLQWKMAAQNFQPLCQKRPPNKVLWSADGLAPWLARQLQSIL